MTRLATLLGLLLVAACGGPPHSQRNLTPTPLPGDGPVLVILVQDGVDDVETFAMAHAVTALGWRVRFVGPSGAHTLHGEPLPIRPIPETIHAVFVPSGGPTSHPLLEPPVEIVRTDNPSEIGRRAHALDTWAQDQLRAQRPTTGGQPP